MQDETETLCLVIVQKKQVLGGLVRETEGKQTVGGPDQRVWTVKHQMSLRLFFLSDELMIHNNNSITLTALQTHSSAHY